MTDRKIERSNGHSFGWQQLLANSIKTFISQVKKKWLVAAQNLQSIKPCWLLNWISTARVVAWLPQASQQQLMPTQKHPVFVLASQGVQLAQAVQESCPKSFDYLLEQPLEQLPDDRQGLKLQTWTQTWSLLRQCCLTNKLWRFYCLPKHNINCVEFEFFKSVTDAKLEPRALTF